MQRRPNIASAASDFALALLALIAGFLGAPLVFAVLLFAAAVTVWGWTRRRALAAMPAGRRSTQGAIALAMIAVVLALAYWIGLATGGHL